MSIRNLLRVLAGILLTAICGCSNPSGGNGTGDGDTSIATLAQRLGVNEKDVDPAFVAEVTADLEGLKNYGGQLRTLAAAQGAETAKSQLVSQIGADARVAKVESSPQGISIEYKSGLRTAIMLEPKDVDPNANPPATSVAKGIFKPVGSESAKTVSPSKKTLFMNPHYWQRSVEADRILAAADYRFDSCGLQRFERQLGEACTLARFMDLSDYSVVHFYSHGWAWPSQKNLQELYLMTGEVGDPLIIGILALGGAIPKDVIVVEMAFGSADRFEKMLFVSPTFIASHNNFLAAKTLVYLGFCYSWMGTWSTKMTDDAGAYVALGFDGEVDTDYNANWSISMYNKLCDHTYWSPVTVGFWYDNIDSDYETDVDGKAQTIEMHFAGVRELVLWDETESQPPVLTALTIPDPVLAKVLSTTLINRYGIAHDGSNSFQTTDLAKIKNLTWSPGYSGVKIKDLTGIDYCTNLEQLFLSTNELKDISLLGNLTKLTILDLQMNLIEDVSPLENLTGLPKLYLGWNTIKDFSPIAKLTNLTFLDLNTTKLTDISFVSGLTKLENLRLADNQIVTITAVSGLTSLKELILQNNQVADIAALVNNPGLGTGDYIDLANNRISTSDPTDWANVKALKDRGVNVIASGFE
jgi:hypothetical protein